MPPSLETEYTLTVRVKVDVPTSAGNVGPGERRIIPITGGTLEGPNGLSGEVLNMGADFQVLRNDGVTDLEARYMLRMADGATVYIENRGLRRASPETMAELNKGHQVDPTKVYFRSIPRFETAAPQYKWLQESVFVATCERDPEEVRIHVYRVL